MKNALNDKIKRAEARISELEKGNDNDNNRN